MLSIGKIALGQHRYYERQVAGGGDDYYSGRGEAPGEWVGAGAEALGLSGHVSAEQFGALIAGLDPRDPGVRLRASERDPKVAALDLTFSAPKSLSVLFAVAPEEFSGELVACHEEAVRAALGYLEAEAVMVRRGEGGQHVERAEGLIAAAYRHRMSRALDPQLHTHVVAANLARGSDGRFTALHGAPLYRAAKTAGFLYQAHLRALVSERLGLQWGEVHKGAAELEGVQRPVIEHFSKRRREMLRAAEEGGIGLETQGRGGERGARDPRSQAVWRRDPHLARGGRARAPQSSGSAQRSWRAVQRGPRARRGRLRRAGPGGRAEPRRPPGGRRGSDRQAATPSMSVRCCRSSRPRRDKVPWWSEVRGAGRAVRRAYATSSRTSRGEMTTAELVDCERRLIAAAVGRAGEGTGIVDALARRARDRRWPTVR